MRFKSLIFCTYLLFNFIGNAQQIPSKKVIENSQLSNYLTHEVKSALKDKEPISESELALYLREKFSERYFYNWENFDTRFETYNKLYPNKLASHTERALDHLNKFNDSTQWVLPFNYLNGEPVNAYALRHLARQHKMIDIAFYYHYQEKNPGYISYFTNQLKSLNKALDLDAYEKIEDGNGVYEAFRSGYRVLNWLQIHAIFLGESTYTDEDQLRTIATLLQHGAHLFERNQTFHPGNHQTRGLSALAMISILFRDFEGTAQWYEHSMKLLEEHLVKEINDDGFQFERSVHYHLSDIGNFYYVYQLAKISNIPVGEFWENKLNSLFTTLTKIAYPDKSAPVLQDDTDAPWAEKNDISGALTLGYLLFEDPEMGYFGTNQVESKMFWYLNEKQLSLLKSIEKKVPTFKSIEFPTTGYYIMREGWKADDSMMIISAGLDKFKPDHQHGDMLGIQGSAFGKILLPNYQVRYSLPDLELFKNSMVKNVALVDNELQGKNYKSNKGGSGFGKFGNLPQPNVLGWESNDSFELFVGSHNGFENIGVNYSRQVINVNNEFWIVKDNFRSENSHTFKQVWQGHYTLENSPNLLRATFDDATGFDIYQLNKIDSVEVSGSRGKNWSVLSKQASGDFSFITILFPYKGYSNRINELAENPDFKGWKSQSSTWKSVGKHTQVLEKNTKSFFFGVDKLNSDSISLSCSKTTDLFIEETTDELTIYLLGDSPVKFYINDNNSNSVSLKSGEKTVIRK